MSELLHLGHDIREIKVRSNKLKNDKIVLHTLKEIRDLDHDMLGALVKHRVVGEIDGGLVVS